MKQILAVLAGWLAREATLELALRQGLERWLAALLSYLAGAGASALVPRF
ncbi:hypothetical protein [Dactylosporangium sp. NPDC000521]